MAETFATVNLEISRKRSRSSISYVVASCRRGCHGPARHSNTQILAITEICCLPFLDASYLRYKVYASLMHLYACARRYLKLSTSYGQELWNTKTATSTFESGLDSGRQSRIFVRVRAVSCRTRLEVTEDSSIRRCCTSSRETHNPACMAASTRQSRRNNCAADTNIPTDVNGTPSA